MSGDKQPRTLMVSRGWPTRTRAVPPKPPAMKERRCDGCAARLLSSVAIVEEETKDRERERREREEAERNRARREKEVERWLKGN